MARYYESKTLIEFVKKYTPTIKGETTMKCVERAIREAPTADVVPKSELEVWKQNRFNLYQKLECYKRARAEVAREIFEEIYEDCFDQFGYINYEALAELKKKHTEGNDERSD